MANQPNVVLILCDDMGFSDIGCFGGEVQTPNLDRLAAHGLRFSQFYSTPRCSPSRASLLTGLHPHQTGIGVLTYPMGPEGYAGNLNRQCVTIAEVLKTVGYKSYLSGKWHVASNLTEPTDAWPMQRGFDAFYGTIIGAGSFFYPNTLTRGNENIDHEAHDDPDFFYTDAISDQAARYIDAHQTTDPDKPFFQYVAYTAPHWPLHAHPEDIAKYKGRFDKGWDKLREERLQRLIDMNILDASWKLTDRDPSQPPWEQASDREWLLRCMEVYAAQIDRMDQGIGRILDALERSGSMDNTLVIFMSDNGACAEPIPDNVTMKSLVDDLKIARAKTRSGQDVVVGNLPQIEPGGEDTYQSYGVAWANLSNTPFRLYKHWTHEGGVASPLICHWPDGISEKGGIRHSAGQLPDIMATLVELSGATYPTQFDGNEILPMEGQSLTRVFAQDSAAERPLYWEHEGNAAIRVGKWKLVKQYPNDWELYDMQLDRTELNDLAPSEPEKVRQYVDGYEKWAKRCGVLPREKVLKIMETVPKAFWDE